MDWYWYVVIIAAITALIAILLFALALYAHRLVFGRRINRNINLKYFSAEDFSLTVRKLPVTFDKTPLYAAVYTLQPEETCKKVVLFCHGIGAGHAPYMTEIARLASFGYAVVAYDSIGCGMSQGKNARGFYANVQCATAAYIAIKGDSILKDKPVHLFGHSWGAYTALCLTTIVGASSVVALSGFNTPSKIMADSSAPVMGGFMASLCRPMWWLINFLRFGVHGNANAVKRIQKSSTPAFLAYGSRDKTVRVENTPALTDRGSFIQSKIYDDKGHNVYNTAHAQKLVDDLNAALSPSRFRSAEARKAYFANFDFKAATEEDDNVMNAIKFFIDSH